MRTLSMRIKDRIDQANSEAVARMIDSDPVWVDVRPAMEVVPGMDKYKIFHAGPPVSWQSMCKPQQNAIIGAIIYEGLAEKPDEALQSILEGRVSIDSNHNHTSVNPMTGVMSASMPVFVIENRTYENRAFCLLHEGMARRRLAVGSFDSRVSEHLQWIRETLAPVLRETVLKAKGIKLKSIMAKALAMGDELHNRSVAATCLLTRMIGPHMAEIGFPGRQISEVLSFLEEDDHFFLSLAMPAAKVAADAAHGIEDSTLVTAMTRNGVEFGIRVSGLGSRWFTGPAQPIDGVYLPGFSAADAGYDMGDSSIMETVGLGGFAMAASPEMSLATGGTPDQGVVWSKQMRHICIATNKEVRLPWVEFVGTPIGIDVRKVVETNILPIIDTAIAHQEGGLIGVGMVSPPITCFNKALSAIAKAVDL